MQRKLALLAAAAVCLTGSAFAADLPTMKSAPVYVPPPPYNWSGFYLGLNAGVGWSNSGHVTINDPRLGSQRIGVGNNSAFVGGGQIGYNYQVGQIVFGAEADIQGVSGGSRINWGNYAFLGLSNGGNGGYLGTVRARAGYAVDRTLLYLTGGLAYGGWNNGPFGNTEKTGYAVGGGVEYAFTNNWTARIEALYVNLNGGGGSRTIMSGGVAYPVSFSDGNGGGLVRVGVNYKF